MSRSRTRELASLALETPAFVYDELTLSEDVASARDALAPTGARLLLAMKAFSIESGLRVMAPWLDGLHASSLFEARLARRVMPDGLVHTTAPGIRPQDLPDVLRLSDRFSFNTLTQWARYRPAAVESTSPGLRVNPGLSFVEDERYDPCARHSKLGVPIDHAANAIRHTPGIFDGLEGLLVHSNCESTDFTELLQVVERLIERLDPLLGRLSWVNLGGGYLFGEAEDLAPLHQAVKLLQDRYGVEVMFEPGTSLVARAGCIVATVLDLNESAGRTVAVLDTSVAHSPEVLEYQYVPDVADEVYSLPASETEAPPSVLVFCAAGPGGGSMCHEVRAVSGAAHDGFRSYILAGASCLAGDHFGEHLLGRLEVGSRVVITNVGAYSMVQASWFNGIALPTVYSRDASGRLTLRRRYTFEDFLRFSGGLDADH